MRVPAVRVERREALGAAEVRTECNEGFLDVARRAGLSQAHVGHEGVAQAEPASGVSFGAYFLTNCFSGSDGQR